MTQVEIPELLAEYAVLRVRRLAAMGELMRRYAQTEQGTCGEPPGLALPRRHTCAGCPARARLTGGQEGQISHFEHYGLLISRLLISSPGSQWSPGGGIAG